MPSRSPYDPKYFAFEIVGVSGVAEILNTKYPTGWRVIQMVAHPDGRVMLLLEDSAHSKSN
jgi:hypothetical protein